MNKEVMTALLTAVVFAGVPIYRHALGIRESPRYAEFPPSKGDYRVVILNVHDGDSVEVGLIVPLKCRLWGVDAPELNTADGKKAKEYLQKLLPEGRIMPARLFGNEKYGRTLADFELPDKFWTTRRLINAGHAKPYDGGKR